MLAVKSLKSRRGSLGRAKGPSVSPAIADDSQEQRCGGQPESLGPGLCILFSGSTFLTVWGCCGPLQRDGLFGWRRANSHIPGFVPDLWMEPILIEMRAVSQADGEALGDLFLIRTSHPREQQAGDRELCGSLQLAEMPTGPQCHCVAIQWSWTALSP